MTLRSRLTAIGRAIGRRIPRGPFWPRDFVWHGPYPSDEELDSIGANDRQRLLARELRAMWDSVPHAPDDTNL